MTELAPSGPRPFETLAVLMGGPSSERDVSMRSGRAVAKGLREAGYKAIEVEVVGRSFELPPGTEAVFIALHGEFGEDGEVQRMLEAMRIPYVGSGPESSLNAFDKVRSKKIFIEAGIPTAEYQVVRQGDARKLPFPLVTKPATQGSSIGVSRIQDEPGWMGALAEAFRYGPDVIVERFIPGRELTVGVVAGVALPVVEVVAPEGWYNFDAKYTKGVTRYEVPARLSPAETRACQDWGLRTFDALKCRGFGRVDMRLTPEGGIFVLELNSIPGFTETSLLPKAAAEYGLNFSSLCDRIVRTISKP